MALHETPVMCFHLCKIIAHVQFDAISTNTFWSIQSSATFGSDFRAAIQKLRMGIAKDYCQ